MYGKKHPFKFPELYLKILFLQVPEFCDFETIYEKIDDRLEDKIVQVSKAAIIASDRLQDTEDFENCTIIKKLERIMKFDKDK